LTPGDALLRHGSRISLRVKSGCLAIRAKSQSECCSSGEVWPDHADPTSSAWTMI
jgi:hypothetical protein